MKNFNLSHFKMQIKPKKFVYYVERKPHWLSNRQGYFTMREMKE